MHNHLTCVTTKDWTILMENASYVTVSTILSKFCSHTAYSCILVYVHSPNDQTSDLVVNMGCCTMSSGAAHLIDTTVRDGLRGLV